jgi:pyruvate/2-oxoglutarate dehydrogenase complex dihydrolipoamide dehydrogenase (E3) component
MISPDDAHNRALVHHVHPHDWVSPTPVERYGLVVIGGGPAGLVAAMGGAGLGVKVALVERGLLGGDCLNWGCVPSKALLASAATAQAARDAAALGVHTGPVEVDFGAVMARMREIRAGIAHHDSAERLRGAGVDVFLGEASFVGRDAVQVGDHTLRFARAVIATGARAVLPPIPGLAESPWLDNERLFELTELPRRVVVIGAGPIGVEMAQALRRFGAEVTVVDGAARVLPREEPDASAVLAARLLREGVDLRLGASVARVVQANEGWAVELKDGAVLPADRILVAAGRRPNVEGLGLDRAGVVAGPRGVEVDDYLRTANGHVYAAGDVCSRFQFTHTADAQARIVLQNALFWPTKRVSGLVVPWATYTQPEIAHVGPTSDDLAVRTDLVQLDAAFSENDRARCEGDTEGYARAWVDGGGKVVAATVVGENAADILQSVVLLMSAGLPITALASTIHSYPNRVEVLKRLGDAWNRRRLTPARASLLRRFLAWWLGQRA